MSKPIKVAVLVGSLRKDSFNRKIAKAIEAAAPSSLTFVHVEYRDLAIYDQDFDALATQPAGYQAFRDAIAGADAVLFVTPEYNRSFPGGLKNAIDVGSRPWGKSVWSGKPAAIVSSSIGAIGGFGASNHLRQVTAFLGMPTMSQPEMYLGGSGALFNDDGSLAKEDTKAFLKNFVEAFGAWIAKTA
jgi:chromate reductase